MLSSFFRGSLCLFLCLILFSNNIFAEESPTLNEVVNPKIKTVNVKDRAFLDEIAYSRPEIELDGYAELQISSKYYTSTSNEKLLLTIQNDPYYKELPKDARYGPFNLVPKYRLSLLGKFSERLSTVWDIEQEPDFPGKYDINVIYDNFKITYGHYKIHYDKGEFVHINKSLEGFQVSNYTNNWDISITKGQERSDPQIYITQINDVKVTLPNQYLMANSVRVYIDDQLVAEHIDYIVDYENGIITFTVPQTKAKTIKVIYEFVNPVADFIPILNNRSFFGIAGNWSSQAQYEDKFIIVPGNEQINTNEIDLNNRTIYLANFPIVFDSENIHYDNKQLIPDQDYIIKHDEGQIILKQVALEPDKNFEITYQYYKTRKAKDIFEASNSQGPYLLSRKNIVPARYYCLVNNKVQIPNVDYHLDYNDGRLFFKVPINASDLIEVSYLYKETETVTKNIKDNPLQVGVSYFEESSLADQGKVLDTVVNETPTVVTENIIWLNNNPIAPSTDIQLFIDGKEIATANYQVDEYLGKLILNQTINPKSNIKVNYIYIKSMLTEWNFYGKTKADLTYTDGKDFNLPSRPVKYNGAYLLTLYNDKYKNGFTLREGYEYRINYDGDKGQAISITFLPNRPSNPSSLLHDNDLPDDKTRINFKYFYIPSTVLNQGTAVQNMINFSGQAKPIENLEINTDISYTRNNFSKPRKKDYFLTKGNGIDNYVYFLGHKNIVKNSEAVYINDRQQQDQTAYYLDYDQGKLSFRNFTPTAIDTIRVEYQYYDTSANIGQENQAIGTLVETQYKMNDVTVYGDFKNIPKEFLPIGYNYNDKGTFYGGGATIQLQPTQNVNVDVHQKDYFTTNPYTYEEMYLKKLKFTTSTIVNLFSIDNNHQLIYAKAHQDPTSNIATTNYIPYQNEEITYQGSFGFGADNFRFTVPVKGNRLEENLEDNQGKSRFINTNYMVGIKNYFLPEQKLIEKISFEPYFYYTKEETVSNNYFSAKNNILNYGVKTVIIPFKNLTTDFSYDQRTKDAELLDEKIIPITNTALGIGYQPFNYLDLGTNLNHYEVESPALEQYGRIEDTSQYRINKFLPQVFLESFNNDFLNSIAGFTKSRISTNWNNTNRKDQNNKYQYGGFGESYKIQDFEPLAGIKFYRLGFDRTHSSMVNTAQSSTASANYANNKNSTKELELLINPQYNFIDHFYYDLSLKDIRLYETKDTLDNLKTTATERNNPDSLRKQKITYLWENKTKFEDQATGNLKLFIEEFYNTVFDENYTFQNTQPISYIFSNKNIHYFDYGLDFYFANLTSCKNNFLDRNEFYNRNDTTTSTGTLYKIINNLNDRIGYKISNSFDLNLRYTNNYVMQWFSTDSKLTKEQVQNNPSEKLAVNYLAPGTDFIYTPIEFLSFKTGLDYKGIKQYETNQTTETKYFINQIINTFGIILRPIKYCSLSGDYLIKNTSKNESANAIKSEFLYKTPITKNFYIDINCLAEYTLGQDLNVIEKEETLIANDKVQRWQIQERKDLVVTGILNLNLEIPIKEIKYIEKFVISGSGRIKIINDYLRPENSYNITGVLISGKVMF